MEVDHYPESRFNSLVSELCEEVDRWKEEAKYWKEKYEEERLSSTKFMNKTMEDQKKQIGQLLSLSLRAVDTPDGVLIQKDIPHD